MKYNKYFVHPGALAPIKATDDMSHPVGVRDGQLFTAPTGGIPEVTAADNGKVLQVINGAWQPSGVLPEAVDDLEGDIIRIDGELLNVDRRLDDIYTGLSGLAAVFSQIEGGGE